MSIKLLDRLLFAQGQCCFFCSQSLPREAASVEHLLAKSRAGTDEFDNCVACCKDLNFLFADMTLKEKMEVVLRQHGRFRCPRQALEPAKPADPPPLGAPVSELLLGRATTILRKHVDNRPRSLKSLHSTLSASVSKELGGTSVEALVDHLRLLGVVEVHEDGSLSYPSLQRRA